MGQTPRDQKTEPSLELPSLPGFGRRKKSRKSRRSAGSPDPSYDGAEGATTGDTRPSPTRAAGTESATTGDTRPSPTQAAGTESATDGKTDVDRGPTWSTEPSLDGQGPDDGDLDADGPDGQDLDAPAPQRRAEKRRTEKAPKEPRKQRSKPLLPGPLAAVLTGLLVGAAGAAGTYGAMTGCEAVRGVSTCGGAPGFFILVAIVTLMVVLGAVILHLAKVDDPASTSFLAVGLVAVISMLVLLDVIFSPWMFVVIPVLSSVAFLLAQWVTSRFTEDTGRRDWT